MLKTTTGIILIGLLSACLSLSTKPSWVDGKSERYSDKDYLLATGSADKEEQAKSRALANLARIFEVYIDDSSEDRTHVDIDRSETSSEMTLSQTAMRSVNAFSNRQLEGAEIVELWTDSSTGQRYALAAISRKKMSAQLKRSIAELDRSVNADMRQSEISKDPIASLRYLYDAAEKGRERDRLLQDLQIVSHASAGRKFNWAVQQIKLRQDAVFNSIKLSTQVERDVQGILKPILQSGASVAGFTVTEHNKDYILQGTLDVAELYEKDGWYWYRGAVEIKLLNTHDHEVRLKKHWPIKVSGQTQKQTEIRLKSAVLKLLNTQLRLAMVKPD